MICTIFRLRKTDDCTWTIANKAKCHPKIPKIEDVISLDLTKLNMTFQRITLRVRINLEYLMISFIASQTCYNENFFK